MKSNFIARSHHYPTRTNAKNHSNTFSKPENKDLASQVYNAIDSKNYSALGHFLSTSRDVDAIGIVDKLTPLAYAIDKKDFTAVKILLDNRVDPDSKTYFNPTPKLNDAKLMEILAVSPKDLLEKKIGYIKEGYDLENPNSWNEPVLNYAIENNQTQIAALLISRFASYEKDNESIFNESPLSMASRLGNEKIVTSLLAKGEFDEPTAKGALYNAVSNGYTNIANSLMESGAGVYFSTETGRTIIAEAALSGNPALISPVLDSFKSEIIEIKSAIRNAQKEVEKANKAITDAKNPKKAKEKAKELALDYMALKDAHSNYIEYANTAICQAYQNKKPLELIIDIMSARDSKKYPENSDISPKEMVSKEIDSLKREGYFRKAYDIPLATFKTKVAENLLDNSALNTTSKASPVEILKKSTYAEDIKNDKAVLNKIFDRLDKTNDIYIDSLITYNSLLALDKNKPLQIIAAKSGSGSVTHLSYGEYSINPTMGMSISEQRKIFFSPLLQDTYATKVLLHEMTHNMMFKLNENQSVEDFKKLYASLGSTISDQKNYLKKPGVNNPFTSDVREIFDRVDGNSEEYSFSQYYNEDVLCDVLGYLYRTPEHANNKNKLESNIKPFLSFLNKNLVPEVLKQIIANPNLEKVKLPDTVRNALIDLYPRECAQKKIIPEKLGKLYEVNQHKDLSRNIA